MRKLAIGLVHFPVLDSKGGLVPTAITNLDIHDLARSARTYGCSDYFIVHPIAAQRELTERICDHWTTGSSAERIPDRKIALALVRTVATLEEAYERMGGRSEIEVWTTAARKAGAVRSCIESRRALDSDGKPVLLLFGTGWGLAPSVIESADRLLEPIGGNGDFNHLSVRAACAIYLDRLRGPHGAP